MGVTENTYTTMNVKTMGLSKIVCLSTGVYFSVIIGFVLVYFRNTAFWPFGQEGAEIEKVDQISSMVNQVGEQIFGEMSEVSKGFVKSMVGQGIDMTKDWDWEKIQNTVNEYLPSEDDIKAMGNVENTDSSETEQDGEQIEEEATENNDNINSEGKSDDGVHVEEIKENLSQKEPELMTEEKLL